MNQRRVIWLLISIIVVLAATVLVSIWLFPRQAQSFRDLVLLLAAAFVGVSGLAATILSLLDSKWLTRGNLRIVPSDVFLFNPSRKGLTSQGSFIGVLLTIHDANPDQYIFYNFTGVLRHSQSRQAFLLQPFLMKELKGDEVFEPERLPGSLKKFKRMAPFWAKDETPCRVVLLLRFAVSGELTPAGDFSFELHTLLSQKYRPTLSLREGRGAYFIGQTGFQLQDFHKLPKLILLERPLWFRRGKLIK